MAVTTTGIIISKTWTKVSDGDCALQSVIKSELFEIVVAPVEPMQSDPYMQTELNKVKIFAFKTAVWCRLSRNSLNETAIITVIK